MPTREIVTITCQWGANAHPLNFYTSGPSCLTYVGLDAWTKLPFTYSGRLNFRTSGLPYFWTPGRVGWFPVGRELPSGSA